MEFHQPPWGNQAYWLRCACGHVKPFHAPASDNSFKFGFVQGLTIAAVFGSLVGEFASLYLGRWWDAAFDASLALISMSMAYYNTLPESRT